MVASPNDATASRPSAPSQGDPKIVPALLAFSHRLRVAGVPISMVETLDAAETLKHVDVSNREHFKAALRTAMVKGNEDCSTFDSLFEIFFALRPGPSEKPDSGEPAADATGDQAGRAPGREASSALLEELLGALKRDDAEALRRLAELAVERFAGITAESSASERYYLYRVLRQLDLSGVLRQAVRQQLHEGEDTTSLEERLLRDEQAQRLEEFRQKIADQIRRRLAEVRGTERAAQAYQGLPIEDVDFLSASPTELMTMREAIRPLARKLAARIARRRRTRRRGRLDVRRTMRRSLSSGGVPLDPAFRHPRASKPELYLLCDISGSVSEFAHFTMSLLTAMKQEFARIRLFVFVDGIDEVTDLFTEGAELAPRNLLYRTKAVQGDGHSDYGNVFTRFWSIYGHSDLDARATMIVTGDARNNYRAPQPEALRSIAERARKVYWLNPEPHAEWNATDSIMDVYRPHCHGVFEVRNLRQLARFVYDIV